MKKAEFIEELIRARSELRGRLAQEQALPKQALEDISQQIVSRAIVPRTMAFTRDNHEHIRGLAEALVCLHEHEFAPIHVCRAIEKAWQIYEEAAASSIFKES